jgi:hypothetical protein
MTGGNGSGTGKRPVPHRARRRPAGGHLSLMELAQLMNQASGSQALPRALAELEARSPAWRRGARQLRRLSREMLHPDYEVVLAEAQEAPALWEELAALPYPEQLAAIETEERFQTWGLCRLLQYRSAAEIARNDAAGAARLANLALRIPRHLGEQRYDEEFVRDLLALSHAYVGNAWRELGELHAAADAFDLAAALRQAGTGYLTFEVDTLPLEALLRRDQRRPGEAVELLDRVEAIYGSAGDQKVKVTEPEIYDRRRHGEARVHRGWCLYHMEQVEAAAAGLEAALERLGAKGQPRLVLAARSGLLWCSLSLGRPDVEARLATALQLADRVGDEADRLRLRRAEARVDLAAGGRQVAEPALRNTAQRCLDLELGFDAALAYLDLAAIHVGAGEVAALHQLADEILPVFAYREVHREAMAALLLFQHACWEERLVPGLLVQLAALLERERRPSLGWWSGAKTLPFTSQRRSGDAGKRGTE